MTNDVPDTKVGEMISRQAVIDKLADLQGRAETKTELKAIGKAWRAVKKMPSAQKTGRWEIYIISGLDGEGCRCSECGFEGVPYWDFCPGCGAKMGEE